jgi:UDPglucose--hexose-1-phosphate uridylyltransferase
LCAYCQLISVERAAGERMVLDRDGYVAFCPFASSQPVEMWLLPTEHEPSFEELARPADFQRLAGVLHALVARLESILPEPAYNMVLRTAPWHTENRAVCHWRIELLPRVAEWAGLELATGVRINPVSPERAAGKLRSIL